MTERLLTREEVAARLRVRPGQVDYLRRRRALGCVKLSAQMIRFTAEDVEEFIRRGRAPARTG